MKYLSIIFILIFSFTAFGQNETISKGDTVVPKFPATATKFDKVKIWQLAAKFTAEISKSPNGNYTINNFENWQTMNYPLMQPLVVREFELSKKKPSRVLLKGSSLIIELFIPNDYNLQDVLSKLLFRGSVDDFTASSYFKELELQLLPKAFSGKLATVPIEKQKLLMRSVSYDLDAFSTVEFKDKTYLQKTFANDFVYNTLQLNAAERAARQTEETIKKVKPLFQNIGKVEGIEGIKIVSEIHYKSFLDKYKKAEKDSFEMYISFEIFQKFVDAEITNQDLVDSSIILVNGSRVKVNLTNYS